MNKIKQVGVVCFAVMLAFFATTLTVSAEVTSTEQRIITALQQTRITEKYITLTKQHLASSSVNLDEAAVNIIVKNIEEASLILGNQSIQQFLSSSPDASRFVSLVVEAGRAADLVVVVNLENHLLSTISGIPVNSLINGTNAVDDIIKNTGSDFTGSLVVAAGIVTLLGATTFVAKKKELF